MPAHAILECALSTVDESYPGLLDHRIGLPRECLYDKLSLSGTPRSCQNTNERDLLDKSL